MAQRKKASLVVDAAAIEADARATLAQEGALKLSALKPPQLRSSLAAKLEQEGFEVTKAFVRRPLRAQLLEALQHGALVPVKSLATHVRGATAAELKTLAARAVSEGIARCVLRGTTEVLAGAEVRVLSAAEAKALRTRLLGLTKTLEKVTKKQGLSLLASDANEQLAEAMAAVGQQKQALPKQNDNAMTALLEAVDSTRDVRTGLSFVPAVVGRLAPAIETSAAVALLLRAAERELLELRPEGGIGRLTEAELSVCPPGPHNTRLSWVRKLTGVTP
jgi:hypothetical protein